METNIRQLIDFEKVDTLLEGFNKSTGFVTAILDLEGNVLSKTGWRQICTEFYCINPETSKKCTISDTELANQMGEGEKYNFYKCLNGLIDVEVPVIIKGEHIANLFFGQFFFEEPDLSFFKKQAKQYGFDEEKYLTALKNVPVVSQEKLKSAINFLLNMTQMISDMSFQKLDHLELNKNIVDSQVAINMATDITERQQAEEELNNEVIHRRVLMEQSKDGIVILDLNGKVFESNKKFAEMLGYPIDSMCSLHVFDWEFLYPREQIIGMIRSIDETGDHFESKHRRKDGSVYDVEISSNATWFNGQKLIFCICRDITWRNQAKQELVAAKEKAEESEEKFRLLHEYAGLGIGYFTPDGIIISFNQIAAKQMNGKPEDFIGKSIFELFPKESADIYYNRLQNAIISTQPLVYEDFIQLPTEDKWFISTHTKIENAQQKVLGIQIISQDITKLKTTEIELKNAKERAEESEEKTRYILKHNPNAIGVFDNEMNLLIVSDRFLKDYDVKDKNIIGKNLYEVFPEIPEKWRNAHKKALQGEVLSNDDDYFIRPDGSITYSRWECRPWFHSDKTIGGMIAYTEVITERKLAEIALKESQINLQLANKELEIFKTFADNAVYGKAIADLKGNLIYVNKFFANIHGYTPEELTGQKISLFHNQKQMEEVGLLLESLIKNGNFAPTEVWHINLNGTEFPMLMSGTLIKDGTGNPLYLACSAIDITERKQAEEKLKTSDRIFNHSIDMLCIAGFDGYFKVLNPAWTKILGWSDEELLSKPWIDFVHHDDRDNTKDIKAVIIDGKEIYQFENRYISKDGTIKWLSWNSFPYPQENIMFGVARDITERKQAEQALLAKMDELERFHKLTVGRETTMVELKKEVNRLLNKLGEDNKYRIVE